MQFYKHSEKVEEHAKKKRGRNTLRSSEALSIFCLRKPGDSIRNREVEIETERKKHKTP